MLNNNDGNGDRDINLGEGNYNERIEGDYTVQTIFENVRASGNITVGDIKIIYQNGNLGNIDKPRGFPQNIPRSNTDKFIGREGELESLHQKFQCNHHVAIDATVEGMGGVGKTELAIQYSLLHLHLHSYPGGICWLKARDSDIGLQIVNFARTDLDWSLD